MFKLLIVDDEPLVQVGIKSMLDWSKLNIDVCETASNGAAAMTIIENESPDIVITDIKMPVMDGLELVKSCREKYGNDKPVFIILTSYEDFHMVKDALSYRVMDYLIKLELTRDVLEGAVKKAIEHIEESRPVIKENIINESPFYDKFFISLLHNLFESEEQFILQSKDLKLNFDYASFICVYGEILTSVDETVPSMKTFSLYTNAFQMIKELLIKYKHCYTTSLDKKHFALIFPFNNSNESEKPLIRDALERVNSTLFSYYKVTMRCGVGSLVENPLLIGDSYQYARQSFHYCSNEKNFVFFEDCPDCLSVHNVFNISIFKDDLTKAFEEYDSVTLKNCIESINGLFEAHPHHYLQALDAACNILYLAISLIRNGENVVSEMYKGIPDGYRSVYRTSSVDQVISWLSDFTDKLCDLFDATRKDYKNHIVASVKKHIQEHITERLSLNEVAAVFSISPSYLSQLFSKYNDTGFTEYINACKINESKRLLTVEGKKVYEVADMLGYDSAFYFSKVFKKYAGVAPSEYVNNQIN